MNPFIPLETAQGVLVDGRIDREIEENLRSLGLKVFKSCCCKELDPAVAYHPDMVVSPLDEKHLLVAPNVYDYYADLFSSSQLEVIRGETFLEKDYPKNIAYNLGRLGDYSFHNFDYTDRKLKDSLLGEKINIKQGYAKCSSFALGENGLITSDRGIYKALKNKDIDLLLVDSGYIRLEGYNYGFIGGATGNLDRNTAILYGQLSYHKDCEKIREFLDRQETELIELKKGEIVDYGSLIPLKLF